MNSMITVTGRRKMAQARAGVTTLPKIVGIALGNGGVDTEGNVLAPGETLNNELLRREADSITPVSETSYRFSLCLSKDELAGEAISEMALYDEDGDIVAVKNFSVKGKDADMEMIFEIDDTF